MHIAIAACRRPRAVADIRFIGAIFTAYGRKHPKPTPGNREKHCVRQSHSEVIVETSIGDIASIITTRSVQEMHLMPGDKVFALVKATNVSIRRA